jgi:ADP-ribose pyrophosphatase
MNRPELEERITQRDVVHRGRMITVEHLRVELPNGKTSTRDVVRHPGAVAVLAEIDGSHLLCVEQYRIAPGQILLEIPAGKLEQNEAPLVCAKRELQEETGYLAADWNEVTSVYTSPGFADERIYIYRAAGLKQGRPQLDEDEFLNVKPVSFEEVEKRVAEGKVQDAKTLIAFQWWLLNRSKG